MNALEKIRLALIDLENVIEEYKNTDVSLKINNADELNEYYNRGKNYILEELSCYTYPTIKRVIAENKLDISSNAKLIMNSCPREQYFLVDRFNKDLSDGVFANTLFQDGIFLPSNKSRYENGTKSYLYLTPEKGIPYQNLMSIRFTYNKVGLLKNDNIPRSIKEDLDTYLLQKKSFSEKDYGIIKEYFLATAPFVISCLISKFKESYIYAKRENQPIIINTPVINIYDELPIVIVLETLYNELFRQDIFKDTIIEKGIASVTPCSNVKYFNEILMSPLASEFPIKQYNLRLILNKHDIERKSANHLSSSTPKSM